jgi:hypothetical protein
MIDKEVKHKYAIISYCSFNYKDAFDFVIKTWLSTDVDKIYIYTDDDKWKSDNERIEIIKFFEPSTDWVINVGRKGKIVHDFTHRHDYKKYILLDVDCYLLQNLGGLFNEDFDVAISRVAKGQMVSSGIMFINKTKESVTFVDGWMKEQNRLFKNKKYRRPHKSSYNQKSLDNVTHKAMKDKTTKVLPISYTEYSFKVKDLDKFRQDYKKKYPPKEMKRRTDRYNKKQKAAVKENDIKVLHFYNNSYRNSKTVKNIFKLLDKEI